MTRSMPGLVAVTARGGCGVTVAPGSPSESEGLMISLILTLALVGFLVWAIVTYIPMPDLFRHGIIVLVVVLIVIYLMQLFGLDIPLPRR